MTISVVLSWHTRAQSCPLTFLSLLQFPRTPSRLRSPFPNPGSGKHAICLIPAVRHVDRRIGPPPHVSTPRRLFELSERAASGSEPLRGWDVSRDGQRFCVTRALPPPPRPAVTEINIIEIWFEKLKEKAPLRRDFTPPRSHPSTIGYRFQGTGCRGETGVRGWCAPCSLATSSPRSLIPHPSPLPTTCNL